jgi:FixJ family two-component response regulator
LARLIAGFGKVPVQKEGDATEAPPALLEPLSNREFDILTLIARDLSNKSMGRPWPGNFYGQLGRSE